MADSFSGEFIIYKWCGSLNFDLKYLNFELNKT